MCILYMHIYIYAEVVYIKLENINITDFTATIKILI